MRRTLHLGTWFGLRVTFTPLAVLCYLALVPGVIWVLSARRPLPPSEAVLGGALSSLVMFLSENLHQLGHAWAARRAGHPMTGIHHSSWFAVSVYPADEPPLPPAVHIRRALGGFWVNLLAGLLLLPLAVWLWAPAPGAGGDGGRGLPPEWGGGPCSWVAAVGVFWNGVVLGLSALLPIDIPGVFTVDGGTLLHYWRAGRRAR